MHSLTNADSNGHCNCNRNSYCCTNSYRDGDIYTDSYCDGDRYFNGHRYRHCDSDPASATTTSPPQRIAAVDVVVSAHTGCI